MFLGSCLVIFLSLRAYGHLDDKLEFIENGVRMRFLWCFRCWRFYWSFPRKGSHHFIMSLFSFASNWYFLKIVLALVASFPTNLVSLNSESVCKSCVCFGKGCNGTTATRADVIFTTAPEQYYRGSYSSSIAPDQKLVPSIAVVGPDVFF